MNNTLISTQANELAERIGKSGNANPPDEDLRGIIDLQTGGELDCMRLDMLTGMVAKRLAKAEVAS